MQIKQAEGYSKKNIIVKELVRHSRFEIVIGVESKNTFEECLLLHAFLNVIVGEVLMMKVITIGGERDYGKEGNKPAENKFWIRWESHYL